MHDKFLDNCANLFRLIQKHLSNPTSEMSAETLQRNFGVQSPVSRYIIPMAVILSVTSLFSTIAWYKEMEMDVAVYRMLTSAVEPFMLFYLVKVASCKVFPFFGIKEETEEKAQVVTLQLMLLYFTVTFICTVLPDAPLAMCLYIYLFFMLWQMAGSYLGINDEKRMTFMLCETAVCAISYVLIYLVINKITPKHPKL